MKKVYVNGVWFWQGNGPLFINLSAAEAWDALDGAFDRED